MIPTTERIMNTNKTFWGRPGLGAISFTQPEEFSLDDEIGVLSTDDRKIAALLPLNERDCMIPIDHGEEVAIPVRNSWELRLGSDGAGATAVHILFRPDSETRESRRLTPELAAWAGMMILGDPALAYPNKG